MDGANNRARYEVTLRGIGWGEAVDQEAIHAHVLPSTYTGTVRATSEEHAIDIVMNALTRNTGYAITECVGAYARKR
jgi:hypothetical protein